MLALYMLANADGKGSMSSCKKSLQTKPGYVEQQQSCFTHIIFPRYKLIPCPKPAEMSCAPQVCLYSREKSDFSMSEVHRDLHHAFHPALVGYGDVYLEPPLTSL